jgi:TetR/AcrR family transcriptional regulator
VITKMNRGRKKTEDQATASRILNAAEEHFAAQGLAGARTDQIALAAHANKAMLYYYFGNKRRLHRAVLENLLRQFRSRVLAPPKSLSASEKLLEIVNGYFDFLATHPNYPRLVQREAMEPGRFDWMLREYFRPLHQLLARTLAEGMASREFRTLDADQLAQITMGMTTSYFAAAPVLSQLVGRNMLAPQAVAARKRALLDFLHHGVMRGSAKPRAEKSVGAKSAGARPIRAKSLGAKSR